MSKFSSKMAAAEAPTKMTIDHLERFILLSVLLAAGGGIAAIPPGHAYGGDFMQADQVHAGDSISSRPKVTKCIVIAVCALVLIGFFTVCIWRWVRHRRHRRRRGCGDTEIRNNRHRNRRRSSRRSSRWREPPPPYSAAMVHQPLTMHMACVEEGRVPWVEERGMTCVEEGRIEDRQPEDEQELPTVPAPAYRL